MASVIDGSDNFDSATTADKTYSDDNSIGVGQTWQSMIASRVSGVTYTNNTNSPIYATVRANFPADGTQTLQIVIDGLNIEYIRFVLGVAGYHSVGGIVPVGSTYTITATGPTIDTWAELREVV